MPFALIRRDGSGISFRDLVAHITKQDLRLRFCSEFSDKFIARLAQIDCAREMAFVAIDDNAEV